MMTQPRPSSPVVEESEQADGGSHDDYNDHQHQRPNYHHPSSLLMSSPAGFLFGGGGGGGPLGGQSIGIGGYISRRHSSKMKARDLPVEQNARGMLSPAGLFFATIKLTVPLAYTYIAAYVVHDIAVKTDTLELIRSIPILRHFVVSTVEGLPTIVHSWAIVEAAFYVCLVLHVRWLQRKCPLEASLRSAPMQEPHERRLLFDRILESERDDPVSFLRGWFFDAPLDGISRYDMLDFLAWCLFEGRNQEHLTEREVRQLDEFVEDVEWRLSLHMYGERRGSGDGDDNDNGEECDEEDEHAGWAVARDGDGEGGRDDVVDDDGGRENECEGSPSDWEPLSSSNCTSASSSSEGQSSGKLRTETETDTDNDTERRRRPVPRKRFKFHVNRHDTQPTFFTNLYENYRHLYENYNRYVSENDRVRDLREYVSVKRRQIHEAEESAIATANNMYANCRHLITDEGRMQGFRDYLSEKRRRMHEASEEVASAMYENAYLTIVDKGSNFDKRINAFTQATACQLTDAWHQVVGMKERLETARFITDRRDRLRNQLKSYRLMLDRMRSMSSSISSRQMADLMRKITKVNESLGEIEAGARDTFLKATGNAVKNLLPKGKEPLRYQKYSADPLFDVSTYPLAFHLLILSVTEGGLRYLMTRRGFVRRTVGKVSYYFHPGFGGTGADGAVEEDDDAAATVVPVVFCHGIGIGLIYYLSLIDDLLALGRPVLLPEIPYVTGFRAWQSPGSVLPPHEVASTLTAMLYECGFRRATFVGHSYGTTWLSYMCKLAPDAMAAVIFLDPICFCLHLPFLTKQFVYHRADPGSVSYMIRTDVIINWTIQRAFPWVRIALFAEELPVPCAVFLSEKDALVPLHHVKRYLVAKGASTMDFPPRGDPNAYAESSIAVTVLPGVEHGDWIESRSMRTAIVHSVDVLGGTEAGNLRHSPSSSSSPTPGHGTRHFQ